MLCIPKSVSDKIKQAVKSGDVPIDKLYDMTSEERNTLFSHYVGKESAELVNTEFEKAMVKGQKQALADYVTASAKEDFAKAQTGSEFSKKLLSPEQTQKLALDKLDERLSKLADQQKTVGDKLKAEEDPEEKANLQAKLDKLKDQQDRINLKKEEIKNPPQDAMLKKINNIKTLLSPKELDDFKADLVKTKFGEQVTPEQGKYIVDKAQELQDLAKDKSSLSGVSDEYLAKRNELAAYVSGLKPISVDESIIRNLATIGRNNLITGISTPLKTLESNVVNYTIDRITRRLGSMSSGLGNEELDSLVDKANKEADDTFSKTGATVASMESPDDIHPLATHSEATSRNFKDVLNDTTTRENFDMIKGTLEKAGAGAEKAEKIISTVAKYSNKIAIEVEHNIPFSKTYTKTFYDALKLNAQLGAEKVEGLEGDAADKRAVELFKDASKISPETVEGRVLRANAQQQAARVLNVNDTWGSRVSVGIKNAINSMFPGAHVGDFVVSMAKIPANIIANGIDNAGAGAPVALKDLFDGYQKIGSDDVQTRYEGMLQMRDGYQHLARIAGTIGAAVLVSRAFGKNDFRTDQYGNSFVKIGNTWINMEYISAISPALAGIMTAKLNPGASFLNEYATGALSGLQNLPGVSEVKSIATTGANIPKQVSNLVSGTETRAVPQVIQDLFKDRPVQRIFFGAQGVESDKQLKQATKQAAAKAKVTARINKIAKAKAKRG